MDSPGIQTLNVIDDHHEPKPSCLERKRGEVTAILAIPSVRVAEYDDSNYEGQTVVEGSARSPKRSDKVLSSFDAKEWLDTFNKPDIFEPRLRSRSCTGRIEGDSCLYRPSEPNQLQSGGPSSFPSDNSKRLKTPDQASGRYKTPIHRSASATNTASFRSSSTEKRDFRNAYTSSYLPEVKPRPRGRSECRSLEVDQNQVTFHFNICDHVGNDDIKQEVNDPESKQYEPDLREVASTDSKTLDVGHDSSYGAGQAYHLVRSANIDNPSGSSVDGPASAFAEFNTIFPHAKQWFDDVPNKCLWQKAKNGRCNNRIAATHKTMICELFDKLEHSSFEQHLSDASTCMGELADLAFCPRRHSQTARAKLQKSLAGSLLRSHGKSILSSVGLKRDDDIPQDFIERMLSQDPANRFDFGRNIPRRRAGRVSNRYVPVFEPYKPRESKVVVDLGEWILKTALKSLTKTECKEGYIYAYWNEAQFGCCKIGFTTKDVDGRLIKWERTCGKAAVRIYPPGDQIPIAVPHAKRLEKLVHAELREYRVKERRCQGCPKSHYEWFKDITYPEVEATIKKWTDWMMTKPYEQIEQSWMLREVAKEALREIIKRLINDELKPDVKAVKVKIPRRKGRSRAQAVKTCAAKKTSQPAPESHDKDKQKPPSFDRYNLRSRGRSGQAQNDQL